MSGTAVLVSFLFLVTVMGAIVWSSTRRAASRADASPAVWIEGPDGTVVSPSSPLSPEIRPTSASQDAVMDSRRAKLTDGTSRLGLAPGWYPDPDASHETYFDGTAWGETRPRVATEESDEPTVAESVLDPTKPVADPQED